MYSSSFTYAYVYAILINHPVYIHIVTYIIALTGKAIWSAEEWIQNSLKESDDAQNDDNVDFQGLTPSNQ